MKFLCVNAGSSSLKFQLVEMPEEKVIISGYIEKIGAKDSFWNTKVNGKKIKGEKALKNHAEAVQVMLDELLDKGAVESLDEIKGVGHRVLHGGEIYKDSVLITDEVIKNIESLSKLGPLHIPGNLTGIRAMREALPNVPNVAVFDTAFHQTMPKANYMYPVPYEWYEKYGVRKYGFHGISHRYVANRISEILGRKDLKIINCHLGQGASLCAIKDGKSIDTTMGLTPLAGVPMGTRCGDVDPSIIPTVMKLYDIQPDEMLRIMNKESGAWGVSGVSTDFRDIERTAAEGDERSILALESRAYIIAQYIAKFIVTLNGVDVITFAGGIGENGFEERERICGYLECFGIKLDKERNLTRGEEYKISSDDSKVDIYIVPTNEEIVIAEDAYNLTK